MSAGQRNSAAAGLAVAGAALACGAVSASLLFATMFVLEGGTPPSGTRVELLAESILAGVPFGIVCALPAALAAPFLTRRSRLGPTVGRTFAATVLATVLTGATTELHGLFLMAPVVGYLVGFWVLARSRHACPLASGPTRS